MFHHGSKSLYVLSEMASSSGLEEFTCVVCFELFTEPVTLPCGHSFCCGCLEKYWKSNDETTAVLCPTCREVFPQKPKMKKSVTIVQDGEHDGLTLNDVNSGNNKRRCEVCHEEAAKRCVPCEILCCEKHVKPHQQKRHKVVNPRMNVEELSCTKHGNPVQLFCKDDGSLMCLMCIAGHQDHKFIPLETAYIELEVNDGQPAATMRHVVGPLASSTHETPSLRESGEQDQSQENEPHVHTAATDHVFCICRTSADAQTPSLDRNTANPWIKISPDFRMAIRTKTKQPYPEHPDRFDVPPQLLCSEIFFSGRHYWEVDVSSSRLCGMGICFHSMARKGMGKQCWLGENPESWFLQKCNNKYSAWHNDQETVVSVPGNPERLGFFLDCEAGELTCFWDSRVLHVFRGNFTNPVNPAIGVYNFVGNSVQLLFIL
uniref:Uncharacterized protein n=1 Tax=Eptatretus burgeri TaxID=7764 RepID=A0A8C4X1V8_EPTBU